MPTRTAPPAVDDTRCRAMVVMVIGRTMLVMAMVAFPAVASVVAVPVGTCVSRLGDRHQRGDGSENQKFREPCEPVKDAIFLDQIRFHRW